MLFDFTQTFKTTATFFAFQMRILKINTARFDYDLYVY